MTPPIKTDFIILGAGIYGLYAAKILSKNGYTVAVMDPDDGPFLRASYVNQARVHNGYHYPRSYSTALKSASYFDRFNSDFSFAINNKFKKIYAISSKYSLASGEQFEKFCSNVGIKARAISPAGYFKPNTVEAAFETCEYAFDAAIIRDYLMKGAEETGKVSFHFRQRPKTAEVSGDCYVITTDSGLRFQAPVVLNATYAAINQVIDLFGFTPFKIKYEICEIINCKVSEDLCNTGITVMDGPFFSVMPFGIDKGHSLSAVTFTPHKTSRDTLPVFSCQKLNTNCTSQRLQNCNSCPAAPKTSWAYMSQLAKKYLDDSISVAYTGSLFAIKPIPCTSEIDDSRPTLIKQFSKKPIFMTVLSGKINTIYDLDKVLL